jgi:hypothetical protein
VVALSPTNVSADPGTTSDCPVHNTGDSGHPWQGNVPHSRSRVSGRTWPFRRSPVQRTTSGLSLYRNCFAGWLSLRSTLLTLKDRYHIQLLRLSFLRHASDPLGPSAISVPRISSEHAVFAGLCDPARWPELTNPRSPLLAATEPISGGSTGLRYSQTIGRVGAGMRVEGRKAYNGRRGRLSAAANGGADMGEGERTAEPSPEQNGKTERYAMPPPKVTFGPAEDIECVCSLQPRGRL